MEKFNKCQGINFCQGLNWEPRPGWSLCSTVLHCRLKGFPEMLTQHLSFFYQFNYMLNFGFIKRLSGYHNQCYSNGAPSNTVNHHSEKKLPGFVQNRNNILLKRPAHSQQRPSFSNRHWADQEGQGQWNNNTSQNAIWSYMNMTNTEQCVPGLPLSLLLP